MKEHSPHRRQKWTAIAVAALIVALGAVLLAPYVPNVFEREPPVENVSAAPRPPIPPVGRGEPGPENLVPIDRSRLHVTAAEGGTLSAPGGGLRLELPPRALRQDTTLEIVRFAVAEGAAVDHFAYDLQPDGLELARPARVHVDAPLGFAPDELELVVYDIPEGRWLPEPDQARSPDGSGVDALISHFSLRRIRVRPGMDFLTDEQKGRGTFYLESDAGNNFERLTDGRWVPVAQRSASYRDLMRLGRLGRMDLITSGRLRAITAARPLPTVFRDRRRTVAMPPGAPAARTGWVKLTRLDARGEPTGHEVIARLSDYGPGPAPRAAGVIADLSRATMEALGLRWGEHFGVGGDNPDLAWIRVPVDGERPPLRYVPLAVEAYDPQPVRSRTRCLW